MSSPSQLGSWDLFFYYGSNDLDLELESDAMMLAIQPERTLYYNNLDSCGIAGYENHPNSISTQVYLRYSITTAFAYRNTWVSDGSNNTKDRRLAVSQNSIEFEITGIGELDIRILYIPFYNYTAYKQISAIEAGVT